MNLTCPSGGGGGGGLMYLFNLYENLSMDKQIQNSSPPKDSITMFHNPVRTPHWGILAGGL